MNGVRLILRLFKRWAEEPIGIFYGLLVFFALRVPDQISDMLAEVVVYTDAGLGPANWWALAGFVVAGLTLANTVWFWLTTVNRTEICIDGGRLQQIDFLDHVQLPDDGRSMPPMLDPAMSDAEKAEIHRARARRVGRGTLRVSGLAVSDGFVVGRGFGNDLDFRGDWGLSAGRRA